MKNKIIGSAFFLLMIVGLFFSATASNGFCLGDYLLNQLGLRAWHNDQEKLGFHYTFFYALLFIALGWRGTTKYLKESHPYLIKKMPWIFLVLLLFIMPAVTEYAKNTYYSFQDGIKAVEYHPRNSTCKVDKEGQKQKMSGTVNVTNHSQEELKVSVKLIDKEYFVEDLVLKDDQNQNIFILQPKQKNYLNFNFYIDMDKTKFESGSMTAPKIKLEQS